MSDNIGLGHFFEQVADLDKGGLLALSVRTSGREFDELEVARSVARRVAGRKGRTAELDRLKSEIMNWATAGGAGAGIYAPDIRAADVMLEDLRVGAAQAIYDAAAVELLGPALDGRSASVLRRRWDHAIE